MIGAAILVMGAVAFYSLVPVSGKAQVLAQQETVATQIANRMVEHLLLLKPSTLNGTTLNGLGLVDSGQTTSPYKFTSIPLDDGWNFSPAKALPNGQGTLTIDTLDLNSKRIIVQISWTGPGGPQTYTTGTVLGGFR